MLTLLSRQTGPFCDGISRRGFLRIGSLGLGGLTLPAILRAQDLARSAANDRSVVMIYLCGGPTQHETFDPKPDAPADIRGSFRPVATCTPGERICELLPKLASSQNKFSLVRTLVGMKNRHESFQCYTGRPGGRSEDREPNGGWPTFGSVASRVLGRGPGGIPPYIDASSKLSYAPYRNRGNHIGSEKVSWPGFTGRSHVPFAIQGDLRADLVLNGVDPSRFDRRRELLAALDRCQRQAEQSGIDEYQRQAFGLLTTSRLAEALDLGKEPVRVRDRYGQSQKTHASFGGAPQDPQQLLLVRRLVESGVRCVTLAFGAWDWHANREGNIEHLAKKYLPVFDHSLSTFLNDLDERGLLATTTVLVWGEFGRTPRINAKGGRDHWPATQSVLLAGGGIQGGRVLGQTDAVGGVPASREVHVQEVFATLYRNLGIDTNVVKIPDLSGRPRYLVDDNRQPIRELL